MLHYFERTIAIATALLLFLFPLYPNFANAETSTSTPAETVETATSTDQGTISAPDQSATSTTTIELVDESPSESGASSTATTTAATSTATSTVSIDTDSDAGLSNGLLVEADTGSNTASGTAASIVSGNATASVNVVNVINTSITDSTGFFLLLNNFGANSQTIDFRSLYQPLVPEGCGLTCQTNVSVTNTSTATVENNVLVRATTGGNSATGTSSAVSTGNAYAGANMVNMVNSNLVDANYMMLVFNNFGDWSGDLVFPGLDFFSNFVGGSSQINVNAGTPVVTAATSTAGITTGQAVSESTTVNTANQNFINNDSLVVLVRVHGSWSGNLFSLPPGISWQQTPDGVELLGSGDAFAHATSATDNSLVMKNDVDVYALTGDNEVQNGGQVDTGNAYASSNVVNMVNTNVVGRNWVLAIVNIFGDWGGNMAFGRPDLWVGSTANLSDGTIHPGDQVALNYTITNNGDAAATDVTLNASFDSPFANFVEGGKIVPTKTFSIDHLAPEETRSLTALAQISDDLPFGGAALTGTAVVSGHEPDGNQIDNTDYLTLVADHGGFSGVGQPHPVDKLTLSDQTKPTTEQPALSVTKQVVGNDTIAPGDDVDYKVTVTNDGGPAYDAALTDTLRLPNGDALATQTWQLGTIQADEEIVIDYTVAFAEASPAGTYTNTARLIAHDSSGTEITKLASHSVEITTLPAPATLTVAHDENISGPVATVVASSTTYVSSKHGPLAVGSVNQSDDGSLAHPNNMLAASAEASWPIGKGLTFLILLVVAGFLATTQHDRITELLQLTRE